jgi:hypothetical protein
MRNFLFGTRLFFSSKICTQGVCDALFDFLGCARRFFRVKGGRQGRAAARRFLVLAGVKNSSRRENKYESFAQRSLSLSFLV